MPARPIDSDHLSDISGVKQIRIVVNKMDSTSPPHSQDRYNAIKRDLLEFVQKTGYSGSVPIIPVSAYDGDNLAARSENMPWYDGATLLQSLDEAKVPRRHPGKPLRLPLQDVITIKDVGTVAMGQVKSGILTTGMQCRFAPGNLTGEVQSIKMDGLLVDEASPGDNVGFLITGVDMKHLHRGWVASDANREPARAVKSFIAQLIVLEHPGEISVGYTPVVDVHTAHVACILTKIFQKLDRKTGRKLEDNPFSVKKHDACLVEMSPAQPLSLENFKEFPHLGRFTVRDMRQTVAIGVVKSVEYQPLQAPVT